MNNCVAESVLHYKYVIAPSKLQSVCPNQWSKKLGNERTRKSMLARAGRFMGARVFCAVHGVDDIPRRLPGVLQTPLT